MKSIFQSLEFYEHSDVEEALTRDDPEELPYVVVAVALNDTDYSFADRLFVRLAHHRDATVRGNALLGFGHLARRFGEVSPEGRVLVEAGLHDPDPHVRAQAHSAFEDDFAMLPDERAPRGR